MANGWQRNSKGNVYFYYFEDGKQKKAPRSVTKWLDNQPDSNVDEARNRWRREHKIKHQKVLFPILTNTAINDLVDRFCTYMTSRKKDPKTVKHHALCLRKYCLPFFVHAEGLETPENWPSKSVRLLEHLLKLGVTATTINRSNVAMRVFWKWLAEEDIVQGTLLLRNAVIDKNDTPLQFTVTPEDVLNYRYARDDVRLMALIGYFFSLRPQELVALRPKDFRAGKQCMLLECCKVMNNESLYSKFALEVSRQRSGNTFKKPKVGSRGWVACFNEKAAREIVAAISQMKPDELIFNFRLDWLITLWRKNGYRGLTLKDLRRASIYYLGHYTDLGFTALKNHARHSDPSTTSLYIRRPGNEIINFEGLDLDA